MALTDIQKQMCTLQPSLEGCQAYMQQINAGLKAGSEAAVQRLKKEKWWGPVLADTLAGARTPDEIANRANILATQFSSTPLKQSAYKLFYAQARTGMQILDARLSIYPEARAIFKGVQDFERFFHEGVSLVTRYDDRQIDAAGIADSFSLLRRASSSAQALARAFNMPEGSIGDEVFDWIGIATGCGGAIATGLGTAGPYGAVGGMVACGVMVLQQVFSKIFGAPREGPDLGSTAWAILQPGQDQQGLVAADAARLAALLKYRYGVESWNRLIGALKSRSREYWRNINIFNTDHPHMGISATAKKLLTDYGSTTDKEGAKGFTTANAVDLFSTKGGSDEFWAAYQLAKSGRLQNWQLLDPDKPEFVFGDVPVRQLLQVAWQSPGRENLTGIRIWGELITFFAAISKREIDLDSQAYLYPWQNQGLPVRFAFTKYDDTQWSSTSPYGDFREGLMKVGIPSKDEIAFYELGNIRLLAALSYLQMNWEWGQPRFKKGLELLTGGQDTIADLPNLDPADPASTLRIPVDPRSKGGAMPRLMHLYVKVRSTQDYLRDVANAAQKAAANSHVEVVYAADAFKRSLLIQQKTAPSASALQEAVQAYQSLVSRGIMKSGAPQQVLTEAELKMIEEERKRLYAPTGVGTVAVLGAAALLGLFLLRR